MSENSKMLRAAKIVSVHGVKGLVKVQVFLEDPHDLTRLGPITNRDATRVYALEIRGQAKGTLVCSIAGISDRDQAGQLRGVELFVKRDALPEIDDDEEAFYISDLVGMDLRSGEQGQVVGRVRAVQDHGAGDIIVVNFKEAGKRDDMYMFTKELFPEVNLAENFLTFVPPMTVSERDSDEGEAPSGPHDTDAQDAPGDR